MSSCCPPSSWGDLPNDNIEENGNTYQPKGVLERIIISSDDDTLSCGITIFPSNDVAPSESQSTSTATSTATSTSTSTPLPVYYSASTNPSNKAIVIFTDVYGISTRMKFICDTFANNNYHAIMPDCFRGETQLNIDPNLDFVTWLAKYPAQLIMDDIRLCNEYLKCKCNTRNINVDTNEDADEDANADVDVDVDVDTDTDTMSIGSIGFCWGGWAIAKSNSMGMQWKCAVTCHPSTKVESLVFKNDETTMFEKIIHNTKMPFLLLPAKNDNDNLKPGSTIVEGLETHGGQSIVFDKMVHGWVTRGNLDDLEVKEDAEKALVLAMEFFSKHL